MDTIKQRLARGETLIVGSAGRILHHNLLQMLGLKGGFHAVWLDLEHIDFSTEKLEIATLACRSQGLDTFVRLPPTDYAIVTRALEAGAGGIMAAQVRSAAQVAEVVQWARFYPKGCRGMNSGGWDGRFATLPLAQFAEQANRNSFIAIQIETLEALEEVEAIAATEGIDLLFLGPADMSQSLGVTGEFMHPKCLAAIDRISAACKKAGKPWGVLPASPEHAALCVEKGCRMLSIGADTRIVAAGIESIKTAYARFMK